jgi:cold shock CspA family protein
MTEDTGHPANPYAGEVNTALRLEDRPGYPGAARPLRCAVCGDPIDPRAAIRDHRGGPWHRLCIPAPDAQPAGEERRAPATPPKHDGESRVLSGRIKWFNAAAGYGFVQTSVGDVMLHATILLVSGYGKDIPPSGLLAEVEAQRGASGRWRAVRVLRLSYDEKHRRSVDDAYKDDAPERR